MQLLVIGASVFMLASLALAWLATAVRILNVTSLKARFPANANVVKAHIDYLLMALLLMAYYLLGDALGIVYPTWAIVTMLFGAAVNPFMFIVVAMHEPGEYRPGTIAKTITMLSFTATTIGFATAAIMVMIW
jgi:hypothetical protein